MPIRRDRVQALSRARRRDKRNGFRRFLLVVFCLSFVLSSMRLLSKIFDEPNPGDGNLSDRFSFASFLNPWDASALDDGLTFVNGDGARLDPFAPTSSSTFFADGGAGSAAALGSDEVVASNEGAVFADLPLPSDDSELAENGMNWGGSTSLSWKRETDLSYFQNFKELDFQDVGSVSDEFGGKTLVLDGKPTYVPDPYVTLRNFANTAAPTQDARATSENSLSKNNVRRPSGMRPAEEVEPGVAFIPSGYRRNGVTQVSGAGTLGQISTISESIVR